jgi:hypothetical protein
MQEVHILMEGILRTSKMDRIDVTVSNTSNGWATQKKLLLYQIQATFSSLVAVSNTSYRSTTNFKPESDRLCNVKFSRTHAMCWHVL